MGNSEMIAIVREQAGQAARRLRQVRLEQRAARLEERAAELATKAQAKVAAKRAELATRAQARSSELAERSSELTERGLHHLGRRLARSRAGDALGIQPDRRGVPWWIAGLAGALVGYALGLLTAPRHRAEFCAGIEAQAPSAARPLAETIKAQITNDPRTSGLPDLRVDVADGTVFVRGTVPPNFDQDALREVIGKVPGVNDVDLQISGT